MREYERDSQVWILKQLCNHLLLGQKWEEVPAIKDGKAFEEWVDGKIDKVVDEVRS